MWKGIYEKLQEEKFKPQVDLTDHDAKYVINGFYHFKFISTIIIIIILYLNIYRINIK